MGALVLSLVHCWRIQTSALDSVGWAVMGRGGGLSLDEYGPESLNVYIQGLAAWEWTARELCLMKPLTEAYSGCHVLPHLLS